MDDDDGGRNDTPRRRREIRLRNTFLAFFEAFGLYSSFDAAMRGNAHRCGKKSPTMAIEGDEAKCSKISQRDGGMINIEAERFFTGWRRRESQTLDLIIGQCVNDGDAESIFNI